LSGPEGRTLQIDLRALLPIVVLGLVVLTIIVTELCGREDVKAPDVQAPSGPTATVGPTLPPGPTATESPEQETATAEIAAGGEDRDQQRQLDLTELQDALEEYFGDEGEYPDTDGNIQTLCVFEEVDIGCALKDVIDPIPSDPLGDAATNGYFYQSDGDAYTLYAIRESELLPACDEHPQHLAAFDSILCLRGPAAP
jgi:hypothetical protein